MHKKHKSEWQEIKDYNILFSVSNRPHRDQRTLYRRAGGHLALGVASTTTIKSTVSSETSSRESSRETIYPVNLNINNHKTYFRRRTKTIPTRLPSKEINRDVNQSSSSTVNVAILDSKYSKELNESNDDENSLDYGLMQMSAAGEGISNKTDEFKIDSKKDESKKTLSDQIAEGKYGLIEKELFRKPPKAPGIISYKTNSETPKDNEKTLGGLDKDEIWLAEDHLLVLKGGLTNDRHHSNEKWKPIDDYEAPKRPVKIPIDGKVPPPFPVQLTPNGPIQFIGHNPFSIFNPLSNETEFSTNNNPSSGHKTNDPDQKNIFAGFGTIKNLTKDQIHDVIPPPAWLFHNTYKDTDLLKHFPFNLPLPDQALNRSEEFDEDDPALFYPPPYSFIYKGNYTNLAPVGPLVPGIILPPPPDFFSVYNPDEDKKQIKTPIDVINRINEIHLRNRITTHASTTTTPAPPKSTSYFPVYRETVRKTKIPSTTQSTKLSNNKIKATTLRPATTFLYTKMTTTPKDDSIKKIYPFDTTTLKLQPLYVASDGPTKLYSTTQSTTTIAPTIIKPSYKQDYGTQTHPIYFEYFDARTANPVKPQYIGPEYEFTNSPIHMPTTSSTIVPPAIKHKKPKSYYQPQFVSSTISPYPENIDSKYVYVTPKTEHYGTSQLSPYPISTESTIAYKTVPIQKPLLLKPVQFDDEISAIRQTLDYYNNGKKFTQKPPKVKAVYEFSFEAAKHKSQEDFRPMLSYDQKNYYSTKPEINYSHLSELINTNSYFPSTTETPVKYYRTKQSATLPPKKIVHTETSAPLQQQQQMAFGQKLRPQNVNYYVRPIYKEVVASHQPQKIISYPAYETQSLPANVDHGYRINNRNVKYRKQNQQQQQQQQQPSYYGQASEVASLLNDTLVNYRPPQRPINPYSEFIDLSQFPQNNPPHIPHSLPPIHPIYQNIPRPYSQQHPQQQYHHYPGPLDLAKFEYPQIPQINPDSVHITFYNRPMEKSNDAYYDVTPRN